jgi:hypothetical protein
MKKIEILFYYEIRYNNILLFHSNRLQVILKMSSISATTIDLKYIAENQPSLCIPRVFANIDEKRIRDVFGELDLGKIQRVDILERKNEKGETFKRIFIHFDKWFWNSNAQEARRRLLSGKDIKIVYDNPWFWKVSANKANSNEYSSGNGSAQRRYNQPHIDFGDNKETRDNYNVEDVLRQTHLEGKPLNRYQMNKREPKEREPNEREPTYTKISLVKKRNITHLVPKLQLKHPAELEVEESDIINQNDELDNMYENV